MNIVPCVISRSIFRCIFLFNPNEKKLQKVFSWCRPLITVGRQVRCMSWTSSSQSSRCMWITWGACVKADPGLGGLGRGLGFCISNKLPGDAGASAVQTTLSSSQTTLSYGYPASVALDHWWISLLWSFGNTQISGIHSRATQSESLGLWLGHVCFEKLPRVLLVTRGWGPLPLAVPCADTSTLYSLKLPTDLVTLS